MKFFGYTVVYNEETLVPYVLPYILQMGYDKYVIYDDGCTDNTIPLLISGLTTAGVAYEVRPTIVNNKDYDFDGRKRDSQLDAINECKRIIAETQESVWMTFTDFDEVIYCSRERQRYFKEYLEMEDDRGYNFFSGRMLNLIWDGKEKDDTLLPHQWDGVRGAWWLSEGMKVTLIKVNDFANFMVYCANHYLGVRMEKEKTPKDLSGCGEFHGFHLKYFDKNSFVSKTARHYGQDPQAYLKRVKACSFPMDMYFLLKGLVSERLSPNKRDPGEGLFLF